VRLPDNRELLISDTVGFIDRLPHALVAAFRATLEEVVQADLVLHVIDAAAPDRERRMRAVEQVLDELGALRIPLIEVFNKSDHIAPEDARRIEAMHPAGVLISARTGAGVDELIDIVTSRLALDVQRVTLTFDPGRPDDLARIARLYRSARVLVHETRDGRISLVADVPRALMARVQPGAR
jgi:GTP-binding protein HflX